MFWLLDRLPQQSTGINGLSPIHAFGAMPESSAAFPNTTPNWFPKGRKWGFDEGAPKQFLRQLKRWGKMANKR